MADFTKPPVSFEEDNPFDVLSKNMMELDPENIEDIVNLAFIVATLVNHRAKQFSQLSVNDNEKLRERLTQAYITHQQDWKNLGLISGPGLVQMLPMFTKLVSAAGGPVANLGAVGIARVINNLGSKMMQQGLQVGGQALGGAMQYGQQSNQAVATEMSTRINAAVNTASTKTSELQEKGSKTSQAIQGMGQHEQQRSRSLEGMFR